MQSMKPTIQKLMNEVDGLDPKDPDLEDKLQLIAKRVADEQKKMPKKHGGSISGENDMPIDPSDVFACDGCQ